MAQNRTYAAPTEQELDRELIRGFSAGRHVSTAAPCAALCSAVRRYLDCLDRISALPKGQTIPPALMAQADRLENEMRAALKSAEGRS